MLSLPSGRAVFDESFIVGLDHTESNYSRHKCSITVILMNEGASREVELDYDTSSDATDKAYHDDWEFLYKTLMDEWEEDEVEEEEVEELEQAL